MASRYTYEKTISNNYIGKMKTIKAHSAVELDCKIKEQLAKWKEEEQKKRLKETAENLTKKDQDRISFVQSILALADTINVRRKWNELKDTRNFPDFKYVSAGIPPTQPSDDSQNEPKFEHVFLYQLRKDAEQKAYEEYKRAHDEWASKVQSRFEAYEEQLKYFNEMEAASRADQLEKYTNEKTEFETAQLNFNNSLVAEASSSVKDNPHLVRFYYERIIKFLIQKISSKNFGLCPEISVATSGIEKVVEFNISLIAPDQMNLYAAHKFVASTKEIKEVALKTTELDHLYELYVFQISLAVLDVASKGYREAHDIDLFVVNTYFNGIEKKNGHEFTSCVLSLSVSPEVCGEINYRQVDPKECIKSLKGLYAGALASLTPVTPILKLNTDDKRFIESRDVIEGLDPTQNLAIMDWQDFEYLVRELFGKIFGGDGGEVKVTQASRDQGVDAVAFDPDPIRGGKFVIQAKRYNNVVGVSAVRDLYGTMMNEHAARGLLVTTSYFGADSRDFVKDKPIQLIDGQNLLALLKQYGYGEFNITLGVEKDQLDK